MTRERPVSVLILALLNLLIAGMCLFAGIAKAGRSLLMLALPPGQRDSMYFGMAQDRGLPIPDLETYLDLEVSGYSQLAAAAVLATLMAGISLVAISYGLLHMRPWARWFTLLYALAMLGWQGAYAIFQIRQVLPVAELYFLDESWRSFGYMPSSTGLAHTGFLIFVWAPAALLIGHAAVILMILWLPSVRAAFRGQAGESEPVPAISPETRGETATSSV